MATGTTVNWKNPNNWHWVDKNCISWAEQYLKKTFEVSLSNTNQELELILKSISGDCDLNQRKSQVINIFDISVKGTWKISDASKKVISGTVEVPEFMHDTKMEELVIVIDTDSSEKNAQEMKNLIRKQFTPLLKSHFSLFSEELMTAHAKDVYITTDEMKGHPTKASYNPKSMDDIAQAVPVATVSSVKPQKGGLVTITQKISFSCTASDLFDALTNPKKITLWTRAPCQFELSKGASFSLFGGNVQGNVISWQVNKNIQLAWKLKTWGSLHESKVTITLEQGAESTELELVQENVPIGEKAATEQNWSNYYWSSIKRTFGFGVLL